MQARAAAAEPKVRVVIADDAPGFRSAARAYLDEMSEVVVVAEAEDGEQATELVERLAPDLLLMDVHMPKSNGLEATKRIRARPNTPHIVLFSLYADDALRRAALAAGADAFFAKSDFVQHVGDAIASVARKIPPSAPETRMNPYLSSSPQALSQPTSESMPPQDLVMRSVAHDLNNLLQGMLAYAEIAQRQLGAGNAASPSLQEIVAIGRRARELVTRLQQGERPTQGTRRALDLREVVDETLRLVRVTLPSDVRLSANIAGELPRVYGNATQLHQVITNLCTNARHALTDHESALGKEIEVLVDIPDVHADTDRLWPCSALGAGWVRICVRDNGVGMSEDTRARIFEPLFSTRDQAEGSGLGLSVVNGIVKAHEGFVTVDSEPGRGTTFCVFLPAIAGV